MSRAAIIILLLVAVISVTLGAYLIVFPRVQDIHMAEAKGSLLTTGRLLKEMDVADEVRLAAKLSELARRPSLRDLIRAAPSESRDRQGWLNKLRAEVASLTTAARAVAPVKDFFVLNDKGVGLVRNIDLHWTGKTPTADPKFLEAIDKTRSGSRHVLVVQEGTNLLRAVVVPVYSGGRVAAILCATFPLDDGIAKARTGDMGLDVEFAYVSKTGIASGALSDEVKKSLEKFVKDKGVQLTKLLEGKAMPAQEFSGAAGRLLVAGVPVSAYSAEGQLGIVLARNVDTLGKPYGELAMWLFGIGGLCLVVLVIVVVVFGGRMAGALKQLEVDALEISSGDEKRKFKVEGPVQVKSVAELLNQIVARARGEEPPEEEEEEPLEALAEEGKEEEAEPVEEPEEVKEVKDGPFSELDVTAPDDKKGVPGKAEREIAAWEEVEEEDVGPPLGESVEESTAEVTLDEAARQMEIERMQEQARQALEGGAIREVPAVPDEDEDDEDHEPPTRVADIGDLQVLRDAAAAGQELKLPGEEEEKPEEKPEEKAAPQAAPQTAEPPPVPVSEPETKPVEAEPAEKKPETEEDKYYREMFEAFVQAKKNAGEKVDKLNLDRFVRKLKKQEEVLKAKHGCKGVRFQVTVKNNQVSLRPRIIR
jgi:hypothetical protein